MSNLIRIETEGAIFALTKEALLDMINYMEDEEIDDLTDSETLELIGLIQDAVSDVISRYADDLREARFDS